jgi:hypothetical protein
MPSHLSLTNLCYLCGELLVGALNDDHVPPRQLFAKQVRRTHSPNLETVRVHKKCNVDYQRDEDYFVSTLAPLAVETYAGRSVVEDQARRLASGERVGLLELVHNEFESRPSKLILPDGLLAKRYNRPRVERIAWKIVRGLFFLRENRVLPEATPFGVQAASPPEDPVPSLLSLLDGFPSFGKYPAVFDYTYRRIEEPSMYLWAMLLWDRVVLVLGHHAPTSTGGAADVVDIG